jgi:Lon-like protease
LEGETRLKVKKILNNKYSIIIFLIIVLASTFFDLPYYITSPGDAEGLSNYITVENGYEGKGEFMLTTVLVGKANVVHYIWAKVSDYRELYPIEQIRRKNESDAEYHTRQLQYMENSKETAIIIAYKAASKFVEVKEKGVVVLATIENMPAAKKLEVGDKIVAIDQRVVKNAEDLQSAVENKKVNDELSMKVIRSGKELTVIIPVTAFPDDYQNEEKDRIGIGIAHTIDRELITDPKITINSEDIGGPSAGLMFTLAIYNELVEEDMTSGYKIAGTGTISSSGTVGPIGGIKQKVVAAHQSGADYFLAPNENGEEGSNYSEAVKVAKDIGTNMKIIPVDTFTDALQFLEQLDK